MIIINFHSESINFIIHRQLHQWSSPTPQQTTLTGGPMYQRPQMIQPTTLPPANMGQPVDWSMGVQYGGYGFQQQQQPMGMYGVVSNISI